MIRKNGLLCYAQGKLVIFCIVARNFQNILPIPILNKKMGSVKDVMLLNFKIRVKSVQSVLSVCYIFWLSITGYTLPKNVTNILPLASINY
jgi:hypothetical protein